jgi:hypothetical protein
VPSDKTERFTSCYQPESKGSGLKLQDDARESTYAKPPRLESGGGGLVSTAHDYLRFCRMMLHGGTLDGVQILSPKTVALFSLNYLPEGREIAGMALPGMFSESGYSGVGFSLGCGVNVNVANTRLPGSLGEYFWGGAAATAFPKMAIGTSPPREPRIPRAFEIGAPQRSDAQDGSAGVLSVGSGWIADVRTGFLRELSGCFPRRPSTAVHSCHEKRIRRIPRMRTVTNVRRSTAV